MELYLISVLWLLIKPQKRKNVYYIESVLTSALQRSPPSPQALVDAVSTKTCKTWVGVAFIMQSTKLVLQK